MIGPLRHLRNEQRPFHQSHEVPGPAPQVAGLRLTGVFRAFKDPVQGPRMVIDDNMFVEQVLPGFVNRTLAPEEMHAYRLPFLDPEDRGMILEWPKEVPISTEPADVSERMESLAAFMTSTELPLLLLYAEPGVVAPAPVVDWYTANLRKVETVYVGQGLHFIQEDQPDAIGRALRDWTRRHGWRDDR